MRIVLVRRIAQVFFLLLFLLFCVVSTFGTQWYQLRGWPVNWFLELDPLVALGTMLSTHTLYRGLLWALVTVVLTVILGRFFCGWVCPFGTLHQFFGWLGLRRTKVAAKLAANRYRKGQSIKYYILIAFLVLAALPVLGPVTLQSGLLDPIPLIHRSVNLALLPVADPHGRYLSAMPRQYDGAWIVGLLFLAAILMNLAIPRFYCRFVCPLGALFGILARNSILRIARTNMSCTHCDLCATACEGACEPGERIRLAECVLCFNCIDNKCSRNFLTYRTKESVGGDLPAPDIGRRGVLVALASSALALPMLRVNGLLGTNWSPRLVRPPGSVSEPGFLSRCIKCGQCMRVCPTNVIVPAGVESGFESLWTPVLNMRNGTSGCQLNCTACGHICPTAAIRPISLDEKLGINQFAEAGPVRIGTAFVDRGRCLPWAMDTPCIVCQENCPVTPKAIFVRNAYKTVRFGEFKVGGTEGVTVLVEGNTMKPDQYGTGDYFVTPGKGGGGLLRIVGNSENSLEIAGEPQLQEGDLIQVKVRLQLPCVDISQCIGCGVCEHECPVSGLRAIRVTAENETRNSSNSLLLERKVT